MYEPVFKPIEEIVGWWREGYLYNFYGRTSSGKTTLSSYLPMLSIAKELDLEEAKEQGKRFFVVTVDKSFKWKRLREILSSHDIEPSKVQDLLYTFEPTSLRNQNKVILQSIPNIVKKEDYHPLLISVDTITEKHRESFSTASRRKRQVTALDNIGLIEKQVNHLKDYAVKHDSVAIITCQMASPMTLSEANTWRDELIGGNPVKYAPDTVIKLKDVGNREKTIQATLVKSRTEAEGLKVKYGFSSSGIKEVT